VRQYSHRLTVWCASPIFTLIAYKLVFSKQKRKFIKEKTTKKFKSKQTSIATAQNRPRTVASLPTPLPFHYPLPLSA
jgi:hypothetical protein